MAQPLKDVEPQFERHTVFTQTNSLLMNIEALMGAGDLIGKNGENSIPKSNDGLRIIGISSVSGVPIGGQLVTEARLYVKSSDESKANSQENLPSKIDVVWLTIDQDNSEAGPVDHHVEISQRGIAFIGKAENTFIDWNDSPESTFRRTIEFASALIETMNPAQQNSGEPLWDDLSVDSTVLVTPEDYFASLFLNIKPLWTLPAGRLDREAYLQKNEYYLNTAVSRHIIGIMAIESKLAEYEGTFGIHNRQEMGKNIRDQIASAWDRVLSWVAKDRKAQIELTNLDREPWYELMRRLRASEAIDDNSFREEVSGFVAKVLSEEVDPNRGRGFYRRPKPPTFFQTALLPTFVQLAHENPDEFIDALFGSGSSNG